MPRQYLGMPGLSVSELVINEDLGTQEIFNGVAQVYVKQPQKAGHDVLLHEYLAARLANSMGVPVPFGEVAKTNIETERAWATAVVGEHGQEYAPPSMDQVLQSEPHILAGIATLDAWIFNLDRTEENVLWAPQIGLWAIDHEKAFTGDNPRVETLQASVRTARAASAMTDLDFDAEQFKPWVQMVSMYGAQWAGTAVSGAVARKLTSKTRGAAYKDFLVKRSADIVRLCVQTYGLEANPMQRRGMDPIWDVGASD